MNEFFKARRRIPWWRRQYLVNRELQIKYAWSGVIIGLVSSALSAGMILWSFWVFNIWQGQRLPKPVVIVISTVLFLNAASIYIATVLSTQRIAGPLFNLLKQFQRVGAGHLEARALFRKGDEIHYVGRRFNEMVQRLAERETAIFEQVEGARRALEEGNVAGAVTALEMSIALRRPKLPET